jgi:hypothetical protein
MSITADGLRNQLAALPAAWAVPMAASAGKNVHALKNLLATQLAAMAAAHAVQIGNLNNQVAAQAAQIQSLYRIMKVGGLSLTLAAVIGNMAYNYFADSSTNPAAPLLTPDVCKKALTECQSGLKTNKNLLDKCREFNTALKSRRDEAMADWEECLNKLEASENATACNSTSATKESNQGDVK